MGQKKKRGWINFVRSSKGKGVMGIQIKSKESSMQMESKRNGSTFVNSGKEGKTYDHQSDELRMRGMHPQQF